MADSNIKKTIGIFHYVLVKVSYFKFLNDFVILYFEGYFDVLIIFERPFLATGKALVYMEMGYMKFSINDEHVALNMFQLMQ